MQARVLWTAAALGGYGVSVLVSRAVAGLPGTTTQVLWAQGIGYFVFGVLLLGAVSRWWRAGSPALWRPFMLSVGSLAAVLDIWNQPPGVVTAMPLDRWMLALLALLVVALLARLLPNRVIRWWLAIDRRLDDADS